MQLKKFLLIGLIFLSIGILFYSLGITQYFSLQSIKEHSVSLKLFVAKHYYFSIIIYICCYIIIVSSTIPAVPPLTLLGGYLFGAIPGGIFSVIAATIGSTISFLVVRYVIYHVLQTKYTKRIEQFNQKMQKYGYSYLLTLQLITVLPYFVINTIAGLAQVPLHVFIWTTAVGSAPFLFINSYAGKRFGQLDSLQDVMKPSMLGILLILAAFALIPFIINKIRASDDM